MVTPVHIHCKNRLVVLTGEWLPWLHGLLRYNRPLYKTTSFLVVSASFHSEMRKSIGNNEETIYLLYFSLVITKLKHATRVTTLWLKQPICFYSDSSIIVGQLGGQVLISQVLVRHNNQCASR